MQPPVCVCRTVRGWRVGFTLIELLVVIAIIAVLASLLVPATGAVLERAREMKCMSNQKQIVVACLGYERDAEHLPYSKEWVPPSYDWWSVDLLTNVTKYSTLIYPYMSDVGTYLCPTFYRVVRSARPDAHRSYSMNCRVNPPAGNSGWNYADNPWKSAKVKAPAICGLITEENITAPTYVGDVKMSTVGLNDGHFAWGGDCPATYHRDDSAIRACFDGHAERIIMDEAKAWHNLWYNK